NEGKRGHMLPARRAIDRLPDVSFLVRDTKLACLRSQHTRCSALISLRSCRSFVGCGLDPLRGGRVEVLDQLELEIGAAIDPPFGAVVLTLTPRGSFRDLVVADLAAVRALDALAFEPTNRHSFIVVRLDSLGSLRGVFLP